jgi:hypothetical protein
MTFMLLPLAMLAMPAPAAAGAGLSYEAPAGCPTRPEFSETVSSHDGDLGAGDATDPGRVLVVSIRKQSGVFIGSFQIRRPSGITNPREVRGPSCSEVADALAMVTAIALRPQPSQPAGDPPAPPPPSSAQPPHDPPPAPPVSDRLVGHTQILPARTQTERVDAGDLRFDLVRTATIGFGGTWGLIPSTILPTYALTLTFANFATLPSGRQRLVGLVYQLDVNLLGSATYRTADTNTSIAGGSFAMSLCQSPRYDSRGLSMLLCLGYGGGGLALATKAPDGTSIASKTVGFGQVVATVELQYNLSAHVLVSARLGGAISAGDTITAEGLNGSRIFQSSPWSAFGTLNVGFRY